MRTIITIQGDTRTTITITKNDPCIHFTVFDPSGVRNFDFHRDNLLKSLKHFYALRTLGVNGNTLEMVIFADDKKYQLRIKLTWKDILGYEPDVLFRITVSLDGDVFTIFRMESGWKEFDDDFLTDMILFYK